MLTLAPDAGLTLWPPGPGRYPFITLALSGRGENAESMRSNASGIGAQIAVRSGSNWSRLQSYRNDTGRGQSLEPLAVDSVLKTLVSPGSSWISVLEELESVLDGLSENTTKGDL